MVRQNDLSKDFDVRAHVVRHLLGAENIPRRDIRHEIPLDSFSSGGRVDLVVMRDNALIGIELKSGKDKVDRLRRQARSMCRCFDHAAVVIDTRLWDKVQSRSLAGVWPTAWYDHDKACFVARYRGEFVQEKSLALAQGLPTWSRSGRTAVSDMASLLWKPEACAISGAAGGWTGTRTQALDWMHENMALKDLRQGVIQALRDRTLNAWEQSFWEQFDHMQEAA